jgi:hypothetical protein
MKKESNGPIHSQCETLLTQIKGAELINTPITSCDKPEIVFFEIWGSSGDFPLSAPQSG